MTRYVYILLLALIAISSACSTEDNSSNPPLCRQPDIRAEFAEDTRTYIDDANSLRWHEGDLITLFYGDTQNLKYRFNGNTGDNSGTFSYVDEGAQNVGDVINHLYAVYPYNEDIAMDSTDDRIIVRIPNVQHYAQNSFGRDANVMAAKADKSSEPLMSFRNCCGYLKLQIYGSSTISHIELRGNNSEILAGAAYLSFAEDGVPEMVVYDGDTTISLNCGEGVTLSDNAASPTEFWFALPPTTFSDGIEATIYDVDGNAYRQSTTNKVEIVRNTIQPMSSFEVVMNEPTGFARMAGVWHLTEWCNITPSFDVYMDINSNGDIELYQRIDSFQWEIFHSTAEIDGDVISGVYSDGVAWGASYHVSIAADTMTWVDTTDPSDISVYTRSVLPQDIDTSSTRAVNSGIGFL